MQSYTLWPSKLKNPRYFFVLFSFLAIITCLLACSSDKTPPASAHPKTASQPKPIKIGGPQNISLLVIIAEKKGFFSQASVQASYMPLQTGKIAMDSVISGDLDLGVLVDSNVAFIRYQPNADVKVVASITEKRDDAIVARKDKGIRSPRDLAGKNVAYLPATTSHIFLARFLKANKVDINKLDLVTMTPPAMQAAMLNGDIAAASVWQPFRYNISKELAGKIIEFKNTDVYGARAILAATSKKLSEHRDGIGKVLKALILAEEWMAGHEEEGLGILAAELKMDPQVLKAVWPEYRLHVQLDAPLLKLIQEEGAWIQQTQDGFKDKPVPSYSDIFAPEPLVAVAPDRVIMP